MTAVCYHSKHRRLYIYVFVYSGYWSYHIILHASHDLQFYVIIFGSSLFFFWALWRCWVDTKASAICHITGPVTMLANERNDHHDRTEQIITTINTTRVRMMRQTIVILRTR